MRSNLRTSLLSLLICYSFIFSGLPITRAQNSGPSLESISEGQTVNGFKTTALYLNDSDKPMGARFIHVSSGFTFDFLQIQSVPQAMIWVRSFPVSDRGEPHTQEHLLVAKGNKGRFLNDFENMSLVTSNAFTQQLETFYSFYTTAGANTFYQALEKYLDALLNPDYTPEEVNREVRNFGVTVDADGKTLRLEEKGSVYNEMVSSYNNVFTRLFDTFGREVYGADHPNSYSAGGTPAGIREMKPENIKAFHDENYHLGNMGMVASFPSQMPLGSVLAALNTTLNKVEPKQPARHFKTEVELPSPKGAPFGQIRLVPYPNRNDQQPSPMVFAWPADLKLSHDSRSLLELFVGNLAGDPTTNLYKKLIDTKTQEMNIGAQGVFGGVNEAEGTPVYIGVVEIPAANMTEEKITAVRALIQQEISRIAAWPDGSPELAEFNARLQNRIIEQSRGLSKFENTPPQFGFRNTGSGWFDHLKSLNETPGFKKSVTLKQEREEFEKLIASKKNFWRDYIAEWKLASRLPYAVAGRPSPELARKEEEDRSARSEAEVKRLEGVYRVSDGQEAIKKYQSDYDTASASIDLAAKQKPGFHFTNDPPLTLDNSLDFKVSQLSAGVPLVASTFDNMTSATVELALRLDEVPEDELVYLSALPALLDSTGVVIDGKAFSYEEMSERLRREILGLNTNFSTNFRTGRVELNVTGSGNNLDEAKRAVEWMKLILFNPNWRPENLARIRDVIDQRLAGLRGTMQNSEESWVNGPANSYRRQDSRLLMATSSFMTREHNLHRLRWMLKDIGSVEVRGEVGAYFDALAVARGKRSDLKALLGALQGRPAQGEPSSGELKAIMEKFTGLSAIAKPIVADAAKELDQILVQSPDSSLTQDWSYLCKEMRHDLQVTPEKTLAAIDTLRQRVLKAGNARLVEIGSTTAQQQLEPSLRGLIGSLSNEKSKPLGLSPVRLVDSRLKDRLPEATAPVFVGLINPNSQSGVFLNSAPLTAFASTDRESQLRFLASKLYGGGGAHSVFSRTIGAGLAYSNGIGSSASSGRVSYYAERTPELPQTLKFVIDVIKKGEHDPSLVEYATALVFNEGRAARDYESRGTAMAADLADGLTPEMETRFYRSILELKKTPNLDRELYERMDDVYYSVLPGYRPQSKPLEGAINFVIGPERQFDLYEAYLKGAYGPDTRLYRLYPRDFWMVIDPDRK